jgi:sulfide:quinone oxidoreductase
LEWTECFWIMVVSTMKSCEMVEMIFEDRDIKWILGAGVRKVEEGLVEYENLEGEIKTETFDFAMLIPAFSGHGFKAYDKEKTISPINYSKVL